ncbi:MAG: SDR family oxidoreductase [Dermatophilaceae bacterium]
MTQTDTSSTPRVAVITGASSGIGAATARALAADGYRVAALARRVDRITAPADELGPAAIAIGADVTDRDAMLAAARRVKDELGGADVLVNNAGVRPRPAAPWCGGSPRRSRCAGAGRVNAG